MQGLGGRGAAPRTCPEARPSRRWSVGIGPALFAYMRMRCGADALKPDLRVAAALRELGFGVPGDEHSILVIARAAAAELDVSLLVLDQLLWGRDG